MPHDDCKTRWVNNDQGWPLAAVALRLAGAIAIVGFAAASQAQPVRITAQNLAPSGGPDNQGVFLTPVFTGFHEGDYDLFDNGAAVSDGLERLAEDGSTTFLNDEFTDANPNGVSGALPALGAFPPPGVIAPGASSSAVFDLDPEANRFLTFATMVIPSNDAFIANEDPMALQVFDADGEFSGLSEVILGREVLDAGTEANTEMQAAFFDQTMADAGTATDGVVTDHPGFLGSEDNPDAAQIILGGTQSVGPGFTFGEENADFTQERADGEYPLLRITAESVPEPGALMLLSSALLVLGLRASWAARWGRQPASNA